MSFNWIESPTYKRNDLEVYKDIEIIFAPNANEWWNLTVKSSGILCLVRGDKSITIGFLSEYNTQEHFVTSLAEQVNKIAHEKI